MKIAIGADHRGYAHKEYIKQALSHIEWLDVGAPNDVRSDYPIVAHALSTQVDRQDVMQGILICGTGVGMAIVANRYPGIYAGVAWSLPIAVACKEDDNVNVLVIPADYISLEQAVAFFNAWHEARFKGGRYAQRISMINNRK